MTRVLPFLQWSHLWHREIAYAGGTAGIQSADGVRGLVSVRAKHVESRRGRSDRFGHRRGEGGVERSCARYSDSEGKWSAVFAGGGHVRVAGVLEEEDGTWGSGEGRGGDGCVVNFSLVNFLEWIQYRRAEMLSLFSLLENRRNWTFLAYND